MQDDYDPFSEEPAPHVAMEKAGNEGTFTSSRSYLQTIRVVCLGLQRLVGKLCRISIRNPVDDVKLHNRAMGPGNESTDWRLGEGGLGAL